MQLLEPCFSRIRCNLLCLSSIVLLSSSAGVFCFSFLYLVFTFLVEKCGFVVLRVQGPLREEGSQSIILNQTSNIKQAFEDGKWKRAETAVEANATNHCMATQLATELEGAMQVATYVLEWSSLSEEANTRNQANQFKLDIISATLSKLNGEFRVTSSSRGGTSHQPSHLSPETAAPLRCDTLLPIPFPSTIDYSYAVSDAWKSMSLEEKEKYGRHVREVWDGYLSSGAAAPDGKEVVNSGPEDLISDLRSSYNAINHGISVRLLEDRLATAEAGHDFKSSFVLYVLGTLLSPTARLDVSPSFLYFLTNMDLVHQYNKAGKQEETPLYGVPSVEIIQMGYQSSQKARGLGMVLLEQNQMREYGCNENVDCMTSNNHEVTCTYCKTVTMLGHLNSCHCISAVNTGILEDDSKYKYPLAISLLMDEQFLILQAEQEGVLFLLNKGTETNGNTVMITCIGPSSSKERFVYEIVSCRRRSSLILKSVAENFPGRMKDFPRLDFILIPFSFLASSGELNIDICTFVPSEEVSCQAKPPRFPFH
ncbi:hypothetical protein VNO80_16224 [Phaseolus coccineus]|uniref:Uncharacterized protein n=1 Tax=Phaseolus coccineus TaxID=3886 RepID=A0AAN9R7R6_PHACN